MRFVRQRWRRVAAGGVTVLLAAGLGVWLAPPTGGAAEDGYGPAGTIDAEDARIGDDWRLHDTGVSYDGRSWAQGKTAKPFIADNGRGGGHSVGVRVEATTSRDRDRVEFLYGQFRTGQRRWTALSLFVPEDFRMYPNMRLVFMQFWQPPGSRSPYPSIELVVPKGKDPGDGTVKIGAHVASGSAAKNHGDVNYLKPTSVRKGKWVDLVLEWEVAPKGGGVCRLWVDGELVVDYEGRVGLVDQEGRVDQRWGVYRNHRQSTVPTSHTLYFDDIRSGDSREDVAPAPPKPAPGSPSQPAPGSPSQPAPGSPSQPAPSPSQPTRSPAPVGQTVQFRAGVNGLYVTPAGDRALQAVGRTGGPEDRYDVLDAGDGFVALRSLRTGKLVRVHDDGVLHGDGRSMAADTRFRWKALEGRAFALQSHSTGKYVAADAAGAEPLVADRASIRSEERFTYELS